MKLAVSDLFVAGLGFDLVGGWLLARGLILSPGVIVVRGTSFYGGNPMTSFAAAEDRIDARFGVGSLLFGFVLQALGYVLELGVKDNTPPSVGRALTAFTLLFAVVGVAYGTWYFARPRRLRKLLLEMAHWHAGNIYEGPQRMDVPYALPLCAWAGALGIERAPDEDNVEWAKRAFNISDAKPGEPGAD